MEWPHDGIRTMPLPPERAQNAIPMGTIRCTAVAGTNVPCHGMHVAGLGLLDWPVGRALAPQRSSAYKRKCRFVADGAS